MIRMYAIYGNKTGVYFGKWQTMIIAYIRILWEMEDDWGYPYDSGNVHMFFQMFLHPQLDINDGHDPAEDFSLWDDFLGNQHLRI